MHIAVARDLTVAILLLTAMFSHSNVRQVCISANATNRERTIHSGHDKCCLLFWKSSRSDNLSRLTPETPTLSGTLLLSGRDITIPE